VLCQGENRAEGSGLRAQGSGLRAQGSGLRAQEKIIKIKLEFKTIFYLASLCQLSAV